MILSKEPKMQDSMLIEDQRTKESLFLWSVDFENVFEPLIWNFNIFTLNMLTLIWMDFLGIRFLRGSAKTIPLSKSR